MAEVVSQNKTLTEGRENCFPLCFLLTVWVISVNQGDVFHNLPERWECGWMVPSIFPPSLSSLLQLANKTMLSHSTLT